jgi:hypothetical protein
VIGIGVAATLKVRRQVVCSMEGSGLVGVTQPALPSVGALEPAQHVIERSVLHHQDDDVLDA